MRLQLFQWELIMRRVDEPEEAVIEVDRHGHVRPGIAPIGEWIIISDPDTDFQQVQERFPLTKTDTSNQESLIDPS